MLSDNLQQKLKTQDKYILMERFCNFYSRQIQLLFIHQLFTMLSYQVISIASSIHPSLANLEYWSTVLMRRYPATCLHDCPINTLSQKRYFENSLKVTLHIDGKHLLQAYGHLGPQDPSHSILLTSLQMMLNFFLLSFQLQ